jgi:hypothetical protein
MRIAVPRGARMKGSGAGCIHPYREQRVAYLHGVAPIAAVTSRIQLFALVAVLTIPSVPAARMAVTIDSISHGRFGVYIVSGWQRAEYTQMGIWPGAEHYPRRYEYCAECVTIMRELWATGRCELKGNFFTMNDCRCRVARGAARDWSSLRLWQVWLRAFGGLRNRENSIRPKKAGAPQNCVPTRSIRRF